MVLWMLALLGEEQPSYHQLGVLKKPGEQKICSLKE